MEINTFIPLFGALVGGLGIGSMLNNLISHITSQKAKQKERRYEEKKAAYIGLLTAVHDAAVRPSDKNSKAYALWLAKCQIFGSTEVSRFAQEIVRTNDSQARELRDKAFESLLDAIRKDLQT